MIEGVLIGFAVFAAAFAVYLLFANVGKYAAPRYERHERFNTQSAMWTSTTEWAPFKVSDDGVTGD